VAADRGAADQFTERWTYTRLGLSGTRQSAVSKAVHRISVTEDRHSANSTPVISNLAPPAALVVTC